MAIQTTMTTMTTTAITATTATMTSAPTKVLSPINLQGGWPTPRLHPTRALQEASAALHARHDMAQRLTYGPEHGDLAFRENLGRWLTDLYTPASGAVPADRILISNGASNGLATILQKFSDPVYTRAVWMVEPTYFLACPVFRDAGLGGKLHGVPETDDGVDLLFLQQQLERVDKRVDEQGGDPTPTKTMGYPKLYRHIIYAMPTFSNPSGRTMTLKHRQQFVQLARRHDALVVSDDVYDVLQWSADGSGQTACYPRLVDVDRQLEGATVFGSAVSNGSFSKMVAPGLRVGWLEAMPAFIEAMATVGATVSGGCQSHFASMVISEMLSSGALTRHIRETLIPTYRERHRVLVQAIQQHLYPLGVAILNEATTGGFFLYVSFAQCRGVNASDIARVALASFNLRIAPGELFSVPDDPASVARGRETYHNGARLCWAWHEEADLREGIRRLAEAVKKVQIALD